jgi:hypothetical protein
MSMQDEKLTESYDKSSIEDSSTKIVKGKEGLIRPQAFSKNKLLVT